MTVMQNTERLSPLAAFLSTAAARIQKLSDRFAAWEMQNRARAELMRYTDRELADIGLNRDQVKTMDLSKNG